MERRQSCNIPYLDLGGPGPTLHFAHANGFPVETYRALLRELQGHRVLGMNQRPLWPGSRPQDLRDWHPLVDDLVRFLETCADPPVVGVGHSLGGVVTAFAAARRKDLFSAIVLIDPVFLPPRVTRYWGPMKRLGLGSWLPLVRRARRRRRCFESKELAFARLRQAPLFARVSDEVLWDYLNAALAPAPTGGFELCYRPEWEARIFATTPHEVWRLIPEIETPCLCIRGAHSDTLRPDAWAEMRRLLPRAGFLEIQEAGHLVPLEKPREVAEAILAFVAGRPGAESSWKSS
jgi:pimeloyl-ACP methyl ester carboxylesterase